MPEKPDVYDLIHEAQYLQTDVDGIQRAIQNGSVPMIEKSLDNAEDKISDLRELLDEIEMEKPQEPGTEEGEVPA